MRSRYPGVEALVRRDTLHLDSRRFLWGGQVSGASNKNPVNQVTIELSPDPKIWESM